MSVQSIRIATPDEIRSFVRGAGKHVLTFVGYSGAGYEDHEAMLNQAGAILARFDPATTLVNIGATEMGIGAVYALARERGFATMGIVSILAEKEQVPVSPCVDNVFYVEDETWGGRLPDSSALSPTSEAMVAVSDTMVGIGGGDAARDELRAAKAAGKQVEFIPADMNHQVAKAKAAKKGAPEPTEFRGSAHAAMT
jgi:hypothetical protein